MRALSTLLVAASVFAAGSAFAQPMANMSGMKAAPAAKTGQGIGVITAIDTKANTITIKHGAIPAVGWPAMTMTFKATPPTLLRGVRVGQNVGFDVRTRGMNAEVTVIRPR
ncbi:copper-binding protein [Sphingomonas oryzagri]